MSPSAQAWRRPDLAHVLHPARNEPSPQKRGGAGHEWCSDAEDEGDGHAISSDGLGC